MSDEYTGTWSLDSWGAGSNLDSLVRHVARNGDHVESRYGPCLEMLGGKLRCPSGSLMIRKDINFALGWMEMFQLLAGVYDPEQLQRIAPNADHSLFTFPMAYGPRIVDDIPFLIQALTKDPGTRQAVLFVGKHLDGFTPNLPCTLTIQFLIRHKKIHAIVNMRSWDLCRGLPYDVMMFSGLLEMIGRILTIETGQLFVHAGSAHIYLDHLDRVPRMRNATWSFTEDVPENWYEAVKWFGKELHNIEPKKVPPGIKLHEI